MNGEPNRAKSLAKWPIFLIGLLAVFLVVGAVVRNTLSPYIRSWVVTTLRKHYKSEITLRKMEVLSVFPEVQVDGEGLVMRYKGCKDVPPLASVRKFSVKGSLFGFFRSPRRFSKVGLDGLEINVSHCHEAQKKRIPKRNKRRQLYSFVIAKIVADGTVLKVFPKRKDKPPHIFDIYKLTLRSAALGQEMSFKANLRNPTPPGWIETAGKFGPWQAGDPGMTPVSGHYTFQNVDLSVFHGLAGILSSEGQFEGVLDRIAVQGTTDTPDFAVKEAGNSVHLRTEFNAIVDGNTGDTLLQPVIAHFLGTTLICSGGVEGETGVHGKTVELDVRTLRGRVEDLIRISTKGTRPPLVGDVSFHTTFLLPPGRKDIQKRLRLDGEFQVRQARFLAPNVQHKVDMLSRRAQGVKNAPEGEQVTSNVKGRFSMKDGVMLFPRLAFSIPGSLVRLHGSYGLESERLDFHGALRLHAKVSQTTTGIKSFLLKVVDPLFEKDGAGTVLPLNVTGTREHPLFKVDIRRAIFK